jgi:hypothetical protein
LDAQYFSLLSRLIFSKKIQTKGSKEGGKREKREKRERERERERERGTFRVPVCPLNV